MISIEVDFWGRPSEATSADDVARGYVPQTVTVDMPGAAGAALVATIRAGKAGAGTGRSRGHLTYADFAQGYEAAAQGALAAGDKAGAARHRASAARMRETAIIVNSFGSMRAASRTAAERSTVLTVADLIATANALGNRWSAACLAIADTLSMDMTGQPTLFDAPEDCNAVNFGAKPFRNRTARKARPARFDAPAVKRLHAKLPPVYTLTYGPIGTPAVAPSALVDVTHAPHHVTLTGASTLAAWYANGPVSAPVRKASATTEEITVHAFTAATGTRRCAVTGCDRGRTAKIHRVPTEAPAPAVSPVTEAPAVDQADATEAPAPAGTALCVTRGFSAHSRRPDECRHCGSAVDAAHHAPAPADASVDFKRAPGANLDWTGTPAPAVDQVDAPAEAPADATAVCECGQTVTLIGIGSPILASHDTPAGALCVKSGALPAVDQVDVPAEAEAPAVDQVDAATARMVREIIAGATWSFGTGYIGGGKRRAGKRFSGPMMHPALPAGKRLDRAQWVALADQVRALGAGAWMADVKAFACESGDVGNPWRAATRSTHERVDAWLSATAVDQVDAPSPVSPVAEAPAVSAVALVDAMRQTIREIGAGRLAHVKTARGGLSSAVTWCVHLVGRMPAGTVATASDVVNRTTPLTCPACGHLAECVRPGCTVCAVIMGACDRDGCELCADITAAAAPCAEVPVPASTVTAPVDVPTWQAPTVAPAVDQADTRAETVDGRDALAGRISGIVPDYRATAILPAGALAAVKRAPKPADYDAYRAQMKDCACPLCVELSYSRPLDFNGAEALHAARVLLAHLVNGTHVHASYADLAAFASAATEARLVAAKRAGASAARLAAIERGYVKVSMSDFYGTGMGLGTTSGGVNGARAAAQAEAPAPAAEAGPATIAEANSRGRERVNAWMSTGGKSSVIEAPADGRIGHVWCGADMYAARGIAAITWCSEIGPALPAGHIGYAFEQGAVLVAVEDGPVRHTRGAAITCPGCAHRLTCDVKDCAECEALFVKRRAVVVSAGAPVDQVDAVAPAAPVAEAPAPAAVPVTTVAAPVADVPAEAPAAPVAEAVTAPAVDQVDAVAVPTGERYRVTVTGRGEVDGYALHVTGRVDKGTAKDIKRTLYAEREALGGVFWLLTSQRGTLGIIPAEGAEAPADWSRVVARAAELLAASTGAPARAGR